MRRRRGEQPESLYGQDCSFKRANRVDKAVTPAGTDTQQRQAPGPPQ